MSAAKVPLTRLLIVVVVALAAAFQIVRSAVLSNFVETNPDVAARAWPSHPRVLLATSMGDIGKSAAARQGASPASVARAMTAARWGPLLIEPFLIAGAESLGKGGTKRAEQLFREARRRDPRSATARYFLAQLYLASNRPVEGLSEASVLTRLVSGGSIALVPGLVNYARQPGAVPNLRKMFAVNPELGNQVMAELARDASNAALVLSLGGNDLGAKKDELPAWQTQLLRSLIDRGDFAQARSLWLRISGLREGSKGLFNPQFEKISAAPPFNWTLGSGNFGVAEPAAGGSLQVIYYGRDDGQFASQLLLLEPGKYELRMRVKREGAIMEASGLAWTVTCQPAAKQLLSLPFDKADRRTGALVGLITVPANCPSQLLVLNGTSSEFAKSEQVMISNLQLVGEVR